MESNKANINEGREAKAMEFSAQSVIYLNETRKWTIFLSILGFIFLGLLVVVSLLMSTVFNTLSADAMPFPGMGIAIGIVYLLLGALFFFPIYYLYKFSSLSRKAIYNEDSVTLTQAFKNLKSHYKFTGIFTIILLSLYMIFFIVAGVSGGLGSLM